MTEKNFLILDKEFLDYCKLNNITDIEKLARETFTKGFTILKYGETPGGGISSRGDVPVELPIITRPASRPIDKTEVVIVDPPKSTVQKWKDKGLIPEDEIIPNNMEQLRAKIPEKKDIYDE